MSERSFKKRKGRNGRKAAVLTKNFRELKNKTCPQIENESQMPRIKMNSHPEMSISLAYKIT